MSSRNERHVTPHNDGWQVEAAGADQASVVTATQADAIDRAREILRNSGGGELIVHGADGAVRESNTVPPG